MTGWMLNEVHILLHSLLRELGYEGAALQEAAALGTLLFFLTALWLGIEAALHF